MDQVNRTAPFTISPLEAEHWPRVAEIYAAGIATGNATFETAVPPWHAWDAGHLGTHRFVATDGPEVVGWTAVRPVSTRSVYAGVVEHSVYVDPAAQRRGAGGVLLDALIESTERAGIWTIQSGIFPENTASLALHRRAGFRVIGTRERPGKLAGVWRDVVFFERRSRTAGS